MYRINRGILSCAGSGLKNRVARMSPAAWYQPGVGVTITGLGVAVWGDQSGNGRDLLQGTDANRPTYLAGVLTLTNAAGQYMTATYAPTDPQTLYMVFQQDSWTSNNTLFSSAGDDMNISQQTATPKVGLFAGSAAAENADAALGAFAIGCFLFNGAGSLVQINAGTATTGNPGSVSGATINLSRSSLGADFQVKELIIFPSAHSAAERSVVRNYLAARHGIAL